MTLPPDALCNRLSRDEVARVIHIFYQRLLDEPLMAKYFAHIANWDVHEAHITDFWWGVMGGKVDNPRPHAMDRGHRDLEFGQQELDLWLEIFDSTLQDQLAEDIAHQWDAMARQIGNRMLERRFDNSE